MTEKERQRTLKVIRAYAIASVDEAVGRFAIEVQDAFICNFGPEQLEGGFIPEIVLDASFREELIHREMDRLIEFAGDLFGNLAIAGEPHDDCAFCGTSGGGQ